jgi:hypothetical protein
LFIVMKEGDCRSTTHNACSDYGRVEAARPQRTRRATIVLKFRRTRGVEAHAVLVSPPSSAMAACISIA